MNEQTYKTTPELSTKAGEADELRSVAREKKRELASAVAAAKVAPENPELMKAVGDADAAYLIAEDRFNEAREAAGKMATEIVTGKSTSSTGPTSPWLDWGRKVAAKIVERKAFDGTAASATMVPSYFDEAVYGMPDAPRFVAALMPRVPVDRDKVDFIGQTVQTNLAAPTTAGETKPTSVLTLARQTVPIETIATVSEAIDKYLLEDIGFLTSFIGEKLRKLLIESVEDQIINGTGTPPEWEGILAVGSLPTRTLGTDSRSDAVWKAINTVKAANYNPTAVLMNNTDWEDVRLEKNADGTYLYGPPSTEGPARMWSLPIVATDKLAAGTAIVGDFAQGIVMYDRGLNELRIFDGDADLYEKNQVVFRAELRAASKVLDKDAFISVTGL